MNKVTIEIPNGKEAKWVNNVLTLVDKEVKHEDIRDKIKTFEDAAHIAIETPEGYGLLTEYERSVNIKSDTKAYIMLKLITYVLNEGWKPSLEEEEKRWYPCFAISNHGASSEYANFATSYAVKYYGSHMAFKSKELAEYAGKQFIDIYKSFLI